MRCNTGNEIQKVSFIDAVILQSLGYGKAGFEALTGSLFILK